VTQRACGQVLWDATMAYSIASALSTPPATRPRSPPPAHATEPGGITSGSTAAAAAATPTGGVVSRPGLVVSGASDACDCVLM
jgi:hypothetical protein